MTSKSMTMPFVKELDGVRAIAVLIVFVSHLGLGNIVPGGLGVTIFFFLSGYLITSLLRVEAAQTGRIDFTGFYVRRTLRIFPPLYVTLLVSWILVDSGLIKATLDPVGVIGQIFFIPNYMKLFDVGAGLPGPPLWSLAVEEHFYLIFPAIFAIGLMALPGRKAAGWCLAACFVVLGLRYVTPLFTGDVTLNYFLSHTRVDSILFGSCLALWQNPILDREKSWKPSLVHVALAGALILGAAAVRNAYFGDTLRYTLQGFGLFVIFSWLLHGHKLSSFVLNQPVLQIMGKYSYTLYLSHGLAIYMAKMLVPGASLVLLALVSGAISFTYSAGMYALIERPLAQLRRRLHQAKPKVVAV